MKFTPLLLSILIPIHAHADNKLYFVGGIGSTQGQMANWLRAARGKLPGYQIEAVPTSPGASFEGKVVNDVIANPGDTFVIAGHSEGATTITNITAKLDALAAQGKIKPDKIRLIKLEGYSFSAKHMKYECWYGQGKGGMTGFNGAQMQKCGGSHVRRHCDTHCSTNVCLHFSVVNSTAPANLGRGDLGLDHGYDSLTPNLEWIQEGAGQGGCN